MKDYLTIAKGRILFYNDQTNHAIQRYKDGKIDKDTLTRIVEENKIRIKAIQSVFS